MKKNIKGIMSFIPIFSRVSMCAFIMSAALVNSRSVTINSLLKSVVSQLVVRKVWRLNLSKVRYGVMSKLMM